MIQCTSSLTRSVCILILLFSMSSATTYPNTTLPLEPCVPSTKNDPLHSSYNVSKSSFLSLTPSQISTTETSRPTIVARQSFSPQQAGPVPTPTNTGLQRPNLPLYSVAAAFSTAKYPPLGQVRNVYAGGSVRHSFEPGTYHWDPPLLTSPLRWKTAVYAYRRHVDVMCKPWHDVLFIGLVG